MHGDACGLGARNGSVSEKRWGGVGGEGYCGKDCVYGLVFAGGFETFVWGLIGVLVEGRGGERGICKY